MSDAAQLEASSTPSHSPASPLLLQPLPPLSARCSPVSLCAVLRSAALPLTPLNVANIMTGIAAASFFSNSCRFGGCGLQFETLAELIVHIEDSHIGEYPGRGERAGAAIPALRPGSAAARCGVGEPQASLLALSRRNAVQSEVVLRL
ncbi:hypothetical protein JZ751_013430 [Albula glossodonta]|uniref:C2H2-type domain-containing protein n=1 Tax=Albula glossodonta TaxID=121402 RepID=A0A8T2N678_9TELE|nr:hypothetical protein JZ751_013430 [Albula glossodonta]